PPCHARSARWAPEPGGIPQLESMLSHQRQAPEIFATELTNPAERRLDSPRDVRNRPSYSRRACGRRQYGGTPHLSSSQSKLPTRLSDRVVDQQPPAHEQFVVCISASLAGCT